VGKRSWSLHLNVRKLTAQRVLGLLTTLSSWVSANNGRLRDCHLRLPDRSPRSNRNTNKLETLPNPTTAVPLNKVNWKQKVLSLHWLRTQTRAATCLKTVTSNKLWNWAILQILKVTAWGVPTLRITVSAWETGPEADVQKEMLWLVQSEKQQKAQWWVVLSHQANCALLRNNPTHSICPHFLRKCHTHPHWAMQIQKNSEGKSL
jgi:hypothetical protein